MFIQAGGLPSAWVSKLMIIYSAIFAIGILTRTNTQLVHDITCLSTLLPAGINKLPI